MKKKLLLAVVSAALAGTATLASAAGLKVNEQGAKRDSHPGFGSRTESE